VKTDQKDPIIQFDRSSGILAHPTSLPGPHGSGDLGPVAYHFINWLAVAGQKIWQILPFEPAGIGNTPYATLSAFAGNPLLVSLEDLAEHGWLPVHEIAQPPIFSPFKVDFERVIPYRMSRLEYAAETFFFNGSKSDTAEYEQFCAENEKWLGDFTLFMALHERYEKKDWTNWPPELVHREKTALKAAAKELASAIKFHKFVQWCFQRQWMSVKRYANEHGVKIVGDMPIFVAFHSSDVWAHQDLFFLDHDGKSTVVAGVPPDYFSKTGQRWGNPLYRWTSHEASGFQWWIDRIKRTLQYVDILRIDHFRGFAANWEIPATEKTAVVGKWVDGPKDKLFSAIKKKLGALPIIAEDLGVITPDVTALRDAFGFPGMKILQFAFVGGPESPFLPHNYSPNSVVYTGTHDNDTTVGWHKMATEHERVFVHKFLGRETKEIHWDLIRLASQSNAVMSIFPFQDILGLDSDGRMNIPGTTFGNWEWRFAWSQVLPHHAAKLYEISALTQRTRPDRLELPAYPTDKNMP
jgi:4-alpha-glucanotransferase